MDSVKWKEDMQNFSIYCDLDGVLVDLAGRMSEIYQEDLKNGGFTEKFYKLMEKLSVTERLDFWTNLNPTSDYMQLWNFIKSFTPTILTSCSGMAIACVGKKKWCSNHLNVPSRRVICVPRSASKQNHAGKNRILIDDLESNINEWEAAGGIGILHKNTGETLAILKKILYTKYDTYDI
jgi:phosphoglycolate phosphatase-like HAD superfamily hydrolase